MLCVGACPTQSEAASEQLSHLRALSTNRTKAEKAQRKAEELEKRLDDRPEEIEEREVERREPNQADVDGIRH